MRDNLKDKKYWHERITQTEGLRNIRYQKLKNGLIAPDRINIVRRDMVSSYLRSVSAKYSGGQLIEDFK